MFKSQLVSNDFFKDSLGGQLVESQFYLMTFDSVTHSMQTEKLAKRQFPVIVMPAPREITQSCGLALKFLTWEPEKIEQFFQSLSVPCRLYKMGTSHVDGKRPLELVAEVQ